MTADSEPRSQPGADRLPFDAGGAARAAASVRDQRTRLQDVAVALSQTVDTVQVGRLILGAAMGALGAPQGWVAVLTDDDSAATLLCAEGYAPETAATWTSIPLDVDTPVAAAIAGGKIVVHGSAAERRRQFPAILALGRPASGIEGSAVVPIVVEGRVIGALGVSFTEIRLLDEDERRYLEALASQASQALDRARLFAAFRAQDERLRFALEASGTGTWEWDIRTDRVEWSREVHDIHGVPAGMPPPSLAQYLEGIHPDDRDRVSEAIRRSLDTLAPYDEEFRVLRPDGTVRWTHGMGKVIPDATGRPERMLGTSHDVTDRKQAELERDRFLEAEREAARMRDAFIGIVSHELRTPITTIFGGTRVLARRWRDLDPDARDDILADVVEEADRLYRLAEDLLVLTRVERGTLDMGDEPVHLGRLVDRVLASERTRWPEVVFETRIGPDLPSVQGEDTYVEQVLRNLISNAAKYGGSGATVTVAATPAEGHVELSVLDEGPGINPAEADRLFELFYRSPAISAVVSGAGIGLFVCRQLVTAMGGQIRAEQRAGGGAAFVVTLKRYEDDDLG